MELDVSNYMKIVESDYSSYQYGGDRTGGNYGYWTTYIRDEKNPDWWNIFYGCTTELPFCPFCGDFHEPTEDCCHTQIKTSDLQKVIDDFEPDEDHWLDINPTGSELDWITTQVAL